MIQFGAITGRPHSARALPAKNPPKPSKPTSQASRGSNKTRSSSREVRTRVHFVCSLFLQGNPPPKKGNMALLGDLEKTTPIPRTVQHRSSSRRPKPRGSAAIFERARARGGAPSGCTSQSSMASARPRQGIEVRKVPPSPAPIKIVGFRGLGGWWGGGGVGGAGGCGGGGGWGLGNKLRCPVDFHEKRMGTHLVLVG